MGRLTAAASALMGKQSATTAAIVRAIMVGAGQPVWTPIQYRKLAAAGYRRNVWVYRCIGLRADAVKGTPWVLYHETGRVQGAARAMRHGYKGNRLHHERKLRRVVSRKELDLVDVHPMLDLLHRPNPEMGGGEFFEAYTGFLSLAGNSYVEAIRVGPEQRPVELWPLRPDRMFVVPDARNRIAGYQYRVGADVVQWERKRGEILHTKLWNPDSDWYGMSPIEAAARSVDQHNAAQEWNTALIQNSARPSGAFVVEGHLDDGEFERVKGEMRGEYAGERNARMPMLLEGGLDWKEMGLSPADMDWLKGKEHNVREICAAFGVPPEMVGDSASRTYANYKEARASFYEETVLPLLDHIRDDLNNWLTPMFGDGLYLDYDRDSIEALQEERNEVWTRAQTSSFLTEDEKRELVGLDPLPNGSGAVILRPMTIQAVPADGSQPAAAPAADAPPAKQAKAWNLRTAEAKGAHWQATDALRMAWEAKVQAVVADVFAAEGERVVRAVRASSGEPQHAADVAVSLDAWRKAFELVYRAVMSDFGGRVIEGLKAQAGHEHKQVEDWWSAEAEKYVQALVAQKVVGVTDVTKATLAALIGEGLQNGESMDSIAKRIADTYSTFSTTRSLVIARTETIAASSAGSWHAAKSTGLPVESEWLATPDSRTRGDHRLADGQRKGLDDHYDVGGYSLKFPGDPAGPAHEVIQCRCAEVYHVVG
jgi:HK97 family phage portal protein